MRRRARLEALGALAALVAATTIACRGARHESAPGDAGAEPTTGARVVAPVRGAEDEYWEHTKVVAAVPVGSSPARGPGTAPVTIVELSAFACASCARVDATLDALRAKYGDQIRVVWKTKPLPNAPAAEPAAEAALEVRRERGDAAFWDAHDRLMARVADLGSPKGVDVDTIVAIASEAGGDPVRVRRAIATRSHARALEEDEELAEDFEVESVPQLFVNGRRLDGVAPQARIERMIDEEIARGRELIASGTRPESLYDARVDGGLRPWTPRTKTMIPLPPGDPSLGGAKADVTVHVFGDYQCALCVAVERMIADVRTSHGDRVRFVWHDLPIERHVEARHFALAAREALAQRGVGAFWKMHDRIANAPQRPTSDDLDRFATEAKLDVAKWKAALASGAHAAELDADAKAAADLGITEPPTFLVVAGRATEAKLVGNIEYASKLPRVVDEALEAGEGAHERDDEHD